jgi:hypothetical protein
MYVFSIRSLLRNLGTLARVVLLLVLIGLALPRLAAVVAAVLAGR